MPPKIYLSTGGEGGIRTLEHLLGCYSLSRRAPSTTRPPLHKSQPLNLLQPPGGIDSGLSGPRPAGALRASKIAPAILSNPRTPFGMLLTFQASAFDHSATSPREPRSNLKRARKGTGVGSDDQINCC